MMQWWFSYIQDRVLFLDDGNGGLVRYRYSNTGAGEILEEKKERYSATEVDQIMALAKPLLFTKLKQSSIMSVFWNRAHPLMIRSLLFSYYWHELKQDIKVYNVEVKFNWLEHDFSKEYLENLSVIRNWKNVLQGKAFLQAVCRTTGKHHKSWRYENVHLTYDCLKGKSVFGIHWDNHAAIPLTMHHMRHLLHDDQLS
jgi:hypothetical protein